MKLPPYKEYLVLMVSLLVFSCKQKSSSNTLSADLHLKRGDIVACGPPSKEFGTVDFTGSCNATTQKDFNLGIALLHSFEYDEAEKQFAKVIDADPACPMGYWGVAMSNFHQVWPSPPTPEELDKGNRAAEKARSLVKGRGISFDYINTITAFYHDYAHTSQRNRILNYAKAMEAMYKKYSADKEVAVFYALSLVASADPADKTFANQKKAGGILTSLYPGQPMHPGIVHYIIHAYDSPELASLALDAARVYASIAPSSAHAQHMPSHIFTRLGLWDEDIRSNRQAAASARCYAEGSGIKGHWDEELHAIDYLAYAYLQKGETDSAKQQVDYLQGCKDVYPVNFKVLYAFAATPARYYLENKLWKDAAGMELQPHLPWEKFPWQEAIVHFTRSLGASHTGDVAGAKNELKRMIILKDSLLAQKDEYKANQVAIQLKSANAWILFGEGHKEQGVKEMKQAVEMENKTEKSPVTPGEVLPAEQMLADMLIETGNYTEALESYETDLKKHPNRFNSLYGAGLAAEKNGDAIKARTYYRKLTSAAAGSGRDEIRKAKAYLEK